MPGLLEWARQGLILADLASSCLSIVDPVELLPHGARGVEDAAQAGTGARGWALCGDRGLAGWGAWDHHGRDVRFSRPGTSSCMRSSSPRRAASKTLPVAIAEFSGRYTTDLLASSLRRTRGGAAPRAAGTRFPTQHRLPACQPAGHQGVQLMEVSTTGRSSAISQTSLTASAQAIRSALAEIDLHQRGPRISPWAFSPWGRPRSPPRCSPLRRAIRAARCSTGQHPSGPPGGDPRWR